MPKYYSKALFGMVVIAHIGNRNIGVAGQVADKKLFKWLPTNIGFLLAQNLCIIRIKGPCFDAESKNITLQVERVMVF